MQRHLIAYATDIYAQSYCGLQIFDKSKVMESIDLTPDNEREVCKTCLHAYAPDMYPKEFTDTF